VSATTGPTPGTVIRRRHQALAVIGGSRDVWAVSTARIDLSSIKSVVAVHRLREVSCLYGFTRFEAAPTSADGDLEDIQLAVRGAPLAQDADWLPAIEQFGEGIFIHLDEAAIAEWLGRNATRQRYDELVRGYGHWCTRFRATRRIIRGPPTFSSTVFRTRLRQRLLWIAVIRRVR
jgi:hypothetical protein